MVPPSAMTLLKNAECLRVETLVRLLDLDGRRYGVSARPLNLGDCFRFLDFCLSFADRETGVIFRVVLVVGAVVGDSLNHYFWVVSTCESTLGVGPVAFRLCDWSTIGARRAKSRVNMATRIGWFRINLKVSQVINGSGMDFRLNVEFFFVFPVHKTRQPQDARGISRCRVGTELFGHCLLK